ncbi:CoA ester lyase [Alcaligenaceae bacterium]|nr:CoA ester lyase [Alcaligenaceae bacterium]
MQQTMRAALFVPGNRPERFAKALAAGADAVIIDLEDAVQVDAKEAAREHIAQFAAENPQQRFWVRVNAADTPWFEADLALCRAHDGIVGVVLPKAETAAQLQRVRELAGKPALPIVESARGVLNLEELAAAEGVDRLAFGYLDLMLDTGTRPDTPGARLLLDHIRCRMLLCSTVAGIKPPIDGVHPDFRDTQALSSVAIQVRDMGFAGVLCIHPAQVSVVHSAFAPSAQEREWAQRVVAEFERTGSAAFQLDGAMIDAPVIERAKRLLAAVV